MTLYVRSIMPEESDVPGHWQRAGNVVGYRFARIVRLFEIPGSAIPLWEQRGFLRGLWLYLLW